MQTSIPRPRLLFIDGLPGSGKSTAATAIGRRLPHARIFLESAPGHPLLVAAPDPQGAAFADIHKSHSWESLVPVALGKVEAFLGGAASDALYVFESHPIQSIARVLFQLDAPQPAIVQFWSDLQDRLASARPRLIYFEERDPVPAVEGIARQRGSAWEAYLVEAVNQSPWMRARALSGTEGARQMLVEYARLSNRLADLWRFPILKLPARPENYEARTEALVRWAMEGA
jgi:hypothetical protein